MTDNKWMTLHSVPRGWGAHQLRHLLNADEGPQEVKGAKIQPTYSGTSLPLGALTMGQDTVSEKAGLLSYEGDGHLLTIAPTRSGKGTTLIVPTLLTYEGSALVIDIKGENYAITARHRASFVNGAKVFKFSPYDNETMYFNPLDAIRRGRPAYGDCRFIAELMVPQEAYGENFWRTEARNLLAAVLLYVRSSPSLHEDERNIQTLVNLTFNPAGFSDTLNSMMAKDEIIELRQLAGVFSSYNEKMQNDVLSTLNSELQPWKETEILHATSRSNFNFGMLKQEQHIPLTVYLCIPPEKLRSSRNVLRTLVGIAVQSMTRSKNKPRLPVLFMLDEFPSLGYMPSILDGLAYAAGYGAQFWTFAQSLSQLQATYGTSWQMFVSNAAVFSAFNVNDVETSKYLSEMLGDTDEYQQTYIAYEERRITEKMLNERIDIYPVTTVNYSELMEEDEKKMKANGWTSNPQGGWQKFKKEPRERNRWTRDNVGPANRIRQLGDRFCLVQVQGELPAIVRKIPYYESPEFVGQYDKWQDK